MASDVANLDDMDGTAEKQVLLQVPPSDSGNYSTYSVTSDHELENPEKSNNVHHILREKDQALFLALQDVRKLRSELERLGKSEQWYKQELRTQKNTRLDALERLYTVERKFMQENQRLQKECMRLYDKCSEMERALEEKQEKIAAALKEKVATRDREGNCDDLRDFEIEQQQIIISDQQQLIDVLRKQKRALLEEIKRLTAEKDEKVLELEKSLADMELDNTRMTKKCRQLIEERTRLETKLDCRTTELKIAQRELLNLNETIESLKVEVGSRETLLELKENEIQHLQIQFKKNLADEVNTNEVHQLSLKYREELKQKMEEISYLKDSLQTLQAELSTLNELKSQHEAQARQLEQLNWTLMTRQIEFDNLQEKDATKTQQINDLQLSLTQYQQDKEMAFEKLNITQVTLRNVQMELSSLQEQYASMCALCERTKFDLKMKEIEAGTIAFQAEHDREEIQALKAKLKQYLQQTVALNRRILELEHEVRERSREKTEIEQILRKVENELNEEREKCNSNVRDLKETQRSLRELQARFNDHEFQEAKENDQQQTELKIQLKQRLEAKLKSKEVEKSLDSVSEKRPTKEHVKDETKEHELLKDMQTFLEAADERANKVAERLNCDLKLNERLLDDNFQDSEESVDEIIGLVDDCGLVEMLGEELAMLALETSVVPRAKANRKRTDLKTANENYTKIENLNLKDVKDNLEEGEVVRNEAKSRNDREGKNLEEMVNIAEVNSSNCLTQSYSKSDKDYSEEGVENLNRFAANLDKRYVVLDDRTASLDTTGILDNRSTMLDGRSTMLDERTPISDDKSGFLDESTVDLQHSVAISDESAATFVGDGIQVLYNQRNGRQMFPAAQEAQIGILNVVEASEPKILEKSMHFKQNDLKKVDELLTKIEELLLEEYCSVDQSKEVQASGIELPRDREVQLQDALNTIERLFRENQELRTQMRGIEEKKTYAGEQKTSKDAAEKIDLRESLDIIDPETKSKSRNSDSDESDIVDDTIEKRQGLDVLDHFMNWRCRNSLCDEVQLAEKAVAEATEDKTRARKSSAIIATAVYQAYRNPLNDQTQESQCSEDVSLGKNSKKRKSRSEENEFAEVLDVKRSLRNRKSLSLQDQTEEKTLKIRQSRSEDEQNSIDAIAAAQKIVCSKSSAIVDPEKYLKTRSLISVEATFEDNIFDKQPRTLETQNSVDITGIQNQSHASAAVASSSLKETDQEESTQSHADVLIRDLGAQSKIFKTQVSIVLGSNLELICPQVPLESHDQRTVSWDERTSLLNNQDTPSDDRTTRSDDQNTSSHDKKGSWHDKIASCDDRIVSWNLEEFINQKRGTVINLSENDEPKKGFTKSSNFPTNRLDKQVQTETYSPQSTFLQTNACLYSTIAALELQLKAALEEKENSCTARIKLLAELLKQSNNNVEKLNESQDAWEELLQALNSAQKLEEHTRHELFVKTAELDELNELFESQNEEFEQLQALSITAEQERQAEVEALQQELQKLHADLIETVEENRAQQDIIVQLKAELELKASSNAKDGENALQAVIAARDSYALELQQLKFKYSALQKYRSASIDTPNFQLWHEVSPKQDIALTSPTKRTSSEEISDRFSILTKVLESEYQRKIKRYESHIHILMSNMKSLKKSLKAAKQKVAHMSKTQQSSGDHSEELQNTRRYLEEMRLKYEQSQRTIKLLEQTLEAERKQFAASDIGKSAQVAEAAHEAPNLIDDYKKLIHQSSLACSRPKTSAVLDLIQQSNQCVPNLNKLESSVDDLRLDIQHFVANYMQGIDNYYTPRASKVCSLMEELRQVADNF